MNYLHERMQTLLETTGWAILPEYLFNLSLADVTAGTEQPDRVAVTRPGLKTGRLAQISIVGSISRRGSMWSELFGGASIDSLSRVLNEVAADESIGTVLLNIDSPGGTIDGLPEVAAQIRRLRESKRVIAIANSLAASAAYWIASQADEVIATPEAMVGSIGVFMVHGDYSKMMADWGVKYTLISAGKYKVEGNPYEPLSDEARTHLQALVNDAYDLFVADVAKGRGINAATVRSDYGEGRVLTAKDAKAAGLIDRVAGYQETIGRLGGARVAEDQGLDPSTASANNAASVQDDTAEHPSPRPSPIGEGASVGNSLAAKRLRLELLEKNP